MQTSKEEKLQKLRSRLFQLVMMNSADNFEDLLSKVVREVKTTLQADLCALYFLDEWKDSYQLYCSDMRETFLFHDHIPLDDDGLSDHPQLFNRFLIKGGTERELNLSVLPLLEGGAMKGFLVIEDQGSDLPVQFLEIFSKELIQWLIKLEGYLSTYEEKKKYERLYKVTTTFHSSINTNGVLREIIDTLRQIYPSFDYYLLLSQDYTQDELLPVRKLSYEQDAGSDVSTQAFLTGELQIEDRLDEKQSYLYAPLKGKQGVYGVLQIITPSYVHFPKKDLEFFVLIATTAGNALENAQLYQQSRRLNGNLKLINSVSQRLNSNLRLTEKTSFMVSQLKESFDAEEVGFLTFENGRKYDVLKGSTDFFSSETSYEFIETVNQMVSAEGDPLFLGDCHSKIKPLKP
ncbi:hypothetical protein LD39_14480, partial [Halobacillus sp. BBL2006]